MDPDRCQIVLQDVKNGRIQDGNRNITTCFDHWGIRDFETKIFNRLVLLQLSWRSGSKPATQTAGKDSRGQARHTDGG